MKQIKTSEGATASAGVGGGGLPADLKVHCRLEANMGPKTGINSLALPLAMKLTVARDPECRTIYSCLHRYSTNKNCSHLRGSGLINLFLPYL